MPNVLWRSLKLTGFGPFKNTTTIDFATKLNVFIAPNEWGKSTIAAGIAAVLFGLPPTSDAGRWGTAKYRNTGSTHFAGELRFCAGAKEYLLRRDFAKNAIELWEISAGEQLNTLPPALLDDILGITQDDYMIINPLNQEIMRGDLESYIVSVFETITHEYQQTLTVLKQQIALLTSNASEIGRSPMKNGTGMLEQIRSQLSTLKTELGKAVQLREVLTQTQQDLAAVEEQYGQVIGKIENYSDKLKLIDKWLNTAQENQRTLEHLATLENMYKEASRLAGIIQNTKDRSKEYEEFHNVPQEQAQVLDHLVRLDTEARELNSERRKLEAQLLETEKQLHANKAYIKSNLAVFAQHNDAAAKHARLQELSSKKAQLEQQIREYETQLEQLRQQIDSLPNWELLGRSPSALLPVIEDTVRHTISAYRRLETLWQRRCAIESKLKDYHIFGELSSELLETASNYRKKKTRLARHLESAKMAWKSAQDKIQAFGARQLKVKEEFEDVAHISTETGTIIAEKVDLETKLNQLEQDLAQREQRTKPSRWQYLVAALFSSGAGLTLWLSWGKTAGLTGHLSSVGTSLITALILALAVRAAQRKDVVTQEIRSQIEQLSQRLRIVNLQLGDLVQLDPEELQHLHQRVKKRDAALRELFAIKQELPREDELAALKDALAKAESAYQSFMETVAPLTSVFEDPQQAYETWTGLQQELSDVTTLFHELSTDEFGRAITIHPGELKLQELNGKWSTLNNLAVAYGRRCTKCCDLLAWLSQLDEQWWHECRQEVLTWESLCSKRDETENALKQLLEPDQSGFSKYDQVVRDIKLLTEALKPLNADTPREEVLKLEQEYLARKNLVAELTARKAELQKELSKIQAKVNKVHSMLRTQSQPVEAILRHNNHDIMLSAKRWHEFQSLVTQRNEAEQQLQALLSTGNSDSIEQLRQRLQQLSSHQCELEKTQQQLAEQLAALGLTNCTQECLRQRKQVLSSKLPKLREDLTTLGQRRQELEEQVTQLKAQQVVDVEEVKNQIEVLTIKEQEIMSELRALTSRYQNVEDRAHNLLNYLSQKLSQLLTAHLRVFTDSQRTVSVDENLSVSINSEGQLVPAQLSSGTREQLIIALRLALGGLLEHDHLLPLIFDDCFVHSDEQRVRKVYSVLAEISKERQIIVFSSQRPPEGCPYVSLEEQLSYDGVRSQANG